jgi:hypothetical protein
MLTRVMCVLFACMAQQASSHRKSKDSPVSGGFNKFGRDDGSSSSDDEIAALLITKPNGTLFQMARKVSMSCMLTCMRGSHTVFHYYCVACT